MTSEIRTNSLTSRAGLSTVTLTDSGPMFSGITTFVDNSGFNLGTGSSIFTPASNTLTFGTNSNERLRIASNGHVAIGTDSPNSALPLTIAGQYPGIQFKDNQGTTDFNINTDSAAFRIQTGTAGAGPSEKFRIGSSGQIGLSGANYGTSGQVLTSGGSGSAATWSTVSGTTINNNADNRLITGSGSANTLNAESNVLYDGTNFGIGKSPSRTLDVQGKIRSSDSVCFGDNSSTPSEGAAIHRPAASTLAFVTNDTERVRIDSNGKLTMSSGTVELESHMIRVGNRTTSQINAGVSTSTGSVTLDTTTNNLLYYANAQWNTVKRIGNDGSTQQLAARSAKALLDEGFTSNGVYWLDMHGAYSLGNAKLHYCLMDSSYDGGGWTMLYSMNHGNNFASGSNYSFSVNVGNPTTINDFTAGNWGYDRRNTFTPAANDQFLIRRSDNNDWKRFVVSNWSPTDNSVSNGWETLRLPNGSNTGHPQWATGQMYDSSGNAVSGHIYFNGCAMGGNCNSGGGDGSGFGNYSQWLDAVGNSAFGGGYNSQSNGGSPLYWGQGNALSQGGSLYIQMFYRKAGTQ